MTNNGVNKTPIPIHLIMNHAEMSTKSCCSLCFSQTACCEKNPKNNCSCTGFYVSLQEHNPKDLICFVKKKKNIYIHIYIQGCDSV